MMTLDLDFWLMLCSREEFSFRNVYVSMLVGTKQLYMFLDDIVNARENVQFSKFVSVFFVADSNVLKNSFFFFFFFFFTLFW